MDADACSQLIPKRKKMKREVRLIAVVILV
jgi:hypothetical protein